MNAYEKMHQALLALDAWGKVVKNNPKDTTAIECAEFVEETIRAALAEPARNCDMPLVVDGPADNNADKAWLVFKRHNPDAYFDVSGLLRCIDWLLATATEQNGENNGSK